ncbi:hypothetical protein GCM10007094_30250 [Pseudovibrio japonicus]|uniref:DUF3224 domain-containing protein n=1 Tax=Pseudovibrio japonicus TaxID=366534 RepID=A0ABQ3EGP4_9HYPH|nr:DUF3224 domain-containing protein [Pseudovibrio japonicus]GHB38725.1 hypothetical protein GCM10007094_30250 [Pseudovibrio japonicus]
MVKVVCTFNLQEWKEEVVEVLSQTGKVSSVRACGPLEGDIAGQVNTLYLLYYVTEKQGNYTGYTRVSGHHDMREGTFIIEETGVFDEEVVRSSVRVVPGSGTGDFKGILGTGSFASSHGSSVESRFELEFAERVETMGTKM